MSAELRINHDDDSLEVVDKINKLLHPHGLRFVCDDQPHDGYELFTLTVLPTAPKSPK